MMFKTLLADDHHIVRHGVRLLLERDGRFEIVAEADSGTAAVTMAAETLPDVVVMDLWLPELNGIEATRQIVQSRPRTKVIGLSGQADSTAGTAMLKAGALGYVLKDAAVDTLIAAIDAALKGEIYVSPRLLNAVMADLAHSASGESGQRGGLSPREREVLQLVADGRSTKQAARELSVSVKTIETHRRNLMEKLQIDNVAELTKYAIRHGLSGL